MQHLLALLEIIHMNSHTKNHRSVFNVIKKLQNIIANGHSSQLDYYYRCSLEHFSDSKIQNQLFWQNPGSMCILQMYS